MGCQNEIETKQSYWFGIKSFISENKFLTFICVVMIICENFEIVSKASWYFWLSYLALWSIMNSFDSARAQLLSKIDSLTYDINEINASIDQLRRSIS